LLGDSCFIFKIRGDNWSEARESDDLLMMFNVPWIRFCLSLLILSINSKKLVWWVY